MLNKLQAANNPQVQKINPKCVNIDKILKATHCMKMQPHSDSKPWWQGMGGLHFEFPFTNDNRPSINTTNFRWHEYLCVDG